MKFDSNRAWKEAAAAVSANREVLFAIAGVFILLPSLAFGLLFPQPVASPELTPEQAGTAMLTFYQDAMPWLLPMAVLQAVGSLSLLALFTDRRRPTVGDAIRLGATGLLPYIGVQLLVGLGLGAIAVLVLALASATGLVALSVVLGIAVAIAAIYIAVKTSLTAPVIMVEGVRNPIVALRRSWALTKGNSARIAVFYALLVLVFVIAISVISALFGIAAAMIAGAEGARVVGVIVSSAMGATMTLYLVAVVAAIHRQLAGPSPEAVGATFE